MRTITDEDGRTWEVVAAESTGAHLKRGATLAFRPQGGAADPIRTTVSFNSIEAADFAIGTMSEKELHRRLAWAKTEAGAA
jgi:hypothetical protein